MVLRSEKHREWLMQLINSSSFPGSVLHEAMELKAEVMTATIAVNDTSPPSGNGSSAPRLDDALQHRA